MDIVKLQLKNGVYYMKNGQIHNDNAPAIEHNNGDQEWYCQGRLHNPNGPARILNNGNRLEFWINGVYLGVQIGTGENAIFHGTQFTFQ